MTRMPRSRRQASLVLKFDRLLQALFREDELCHAELYVNSPSCQRRWEHGGAHIALNDSTFMSWSVQ